MFQQCYSKGVEWGRLVIREYTIPTRYLCSLLSEAQKLGMFQEINISGDGIDEYLDEAVAVVFRDFMQARNRRLDSLAISEFSETSRIASILFQGLKSNNIRKFELENVHLQFDDRMQVWQDVVPEFASVIYRFLKEGRSLNFKGPNHWSIWSPGYAAIRHRSGFPSHQAVLKSSLAISNFTYCCYTIEPMEHVSNIQSTFFIILNNNS
jgi:hypothetical protein